jgi:hypothetical protein
MSMTPFEIRLELLKMAKDMLLEDFHSKKDYLSNNWQMQVESAKVAGTSIPTHPDLPTFPQESDIIKKAEALNGFVSLTIPQSDIKITKKSNS